jgi:hypothetical protein
MKQLSSTIPDEILNHPAYTDEFGERYEQYGRDYLLIFMDLLFSGELRNPTIVVEEVSEDEYYQDIIDRNEEYIYGYGSNV